MILALAALSLAFATPAGGGWIELFDGHSTAGWEQTGPGSFTIEHGALVTHGGMGLLWYSRRRFRDFELQVEWKVADRCDNSGVFVRFPGRPRSPNDAVVSGYEAQIDECDPGGDLYRTGALYAKSPRLRDAARPAGQWNLYDITVVGQHYSVVLNGAKVNDFHGGRGRVGYIGVQNHDDGSRLSFRRIRIRSLSK